MACVFDDGVAQVGDRCNALLEFIQGVLVFPPLRQAVGIGHGEQGGGGDALIDAQYFVHFEQLRVDHFMCGMAQDPPLSRRVGFRPMSG